MPIAKNNLQDTDTSSTCTVKLGHEAQPKVTVEKYQKLSLLVPGELHYLMGFADRPASNCHFKLKVHAKGQSGGLGG